MLSIVIRFKYSSVIVVHRSLGIIFNNSTSKSIVLRLSEVPDVTAKKAQRAIVLQQNRIREVK